jgi:DNA polymerase-4
MPMFKALALCPDAVVIRPDMGRYAEVSRAVRAIFRDATPAVEPVSLDEAYLDLAGTAAAHGRPPAATLGLLARRVEAELGITVSIGLSHNKLLAKLASDLDKPRGFAVIGRAETAAFLAGKPARALPGVGPKAALRLADDGIETIGQLQALGRVALRARYGSWGERLASLAAGEDRRNVESDREAVGISAENTFEYDLSGAAALEAELWPLAEKLSRRLKAAGLAAAAVQLKLKTAQFRILTRRRALDRPTQLAEALYRTGCALLAPEAAKRSYRLIGIGAAELVPAAESADDDLFARRDDRAEKVERAIDDLRARFGDDAIGKGRGLRRARGPRAPEITSSRRRPPS